MLDVLRAGPLTTVQDLGRTGLAHLGIPRSGALDQPALTLANRLVGNPEDLAGLEITWSGCELRFHCAAVFAVTGAPAPIRLDRRPVPFGVPVAARSGAALRIGAPVHGVRTYLAVAGGIAVPPVLGSRSHDTLSGLGPPPLRDGDRLPLGDPVGLPGPVHFTPLSAPPDPVVVRVRLGPRDDWFTEDAIRTLLTCEYQVSPVSNRVGARLVGPALDRARPGELPSEGLVLGAVQVPADGAPLVFLADHPTTGGYPVIAVVEPADLPLFAQARPGTTLRFRGPQR
ncbi:MAG TPA: biotin-dependent carboxyltransferase family protein [Micromonosporaceae bacterium]